MCGEDPSLGLDADLPAAKSAAKDPLLRVKMADVERPAFHKREVRRRKTNYFALKLVLGWIVFLGALVVASHYLWKEKPREEVAKIADTAAKGSLADEDVAFLDKAYPECLQKIGGFLSAGTPEERNQFVRTPVATAGRMARFYQMNPIANVDPKSVRATGGGVIRLKEGRAIEARFQTTDNRQFDAVFFPEAGEWRLDWEAFARYGDHPWTLFLTESGPAEGEFRLFARERLAEQRSEISRLNIVLHAPRFGYPADASEASPEFLIDQESEEGRLIKAALAERAAGRRILGSKLPNNDPDGMIRVRVRVKRSEGTLGREFTIEKVLACHWLSVDDPGVELPR